MTWTLLCEDVGKKQVVNSFDDIERAAQRTIHYAQSTHGIPTLMELAFDNQSMMAIVVGGAWSAAFFNDKINGLKLYSQQPNEIREEGHTPLPFMQFGSEGEMDSENTISPTQAWEGLRYYFATGKRPETIPWAGYMRVNPDVGQ